MDLRVVAQYGLGALAAWRVFSYVDDRIAFTADIRNGMRAGPVKAFLDGKVKEGYNIALAWYETLAKDPRKAAIEMYGDKRSFQDVEDQSNRVAHWATAQGLKFGDCVALMMENRPEFIVSWLGLAKVGVKVALINHNLRQKPLLHCISVVSPRWIIVDSELADAVAEIAPQLREASVQIAVSGPKPAPIGVHLDPLLATQPTSRQPDEVLRRPKMTDVFGYIYTSGTTGLPKAATVLHARMVGWGKTMQLVFGVTASDRVYTVLPLYHSAGGGLGANTMVVGGATLCLAKKFSASKFWQEASEYRATVTQYIGELCRYLLHVPKSSYDRKHTIRIAIGNGLRPDIWSEFQDRFAIPIIGEFYGATESNVSMINISSTVESRGYVGRLGVIARAITGAKLIKFDVDKEEPIRDKNGFCIECGIDEPGELIGPIIEGSVTTQVAQYTDDKATAKKIMRDVFKKGDAYFRTGDLLARNSFNYYSFVDRIGDTFRWKGENVSTTEVAEVLGVFPGIKEANVYGVKIPGTDGRACMAACVWDGQLDLKALQKHVVSQLPSYAVPLFIRRLPELEITGTFKHTKVALRDQGFDLAKVSDPIVWLNPQRKAYEPFTREAAAQLASGAAKF